jgi:sulfur relay (sulfurtransferase) complex TusBCD TusD component (DsrE family)
MKALVILNDLVEGAHRSSMDELTAWSIEADKIITF